MKLPTLYKKTSKGAIQQWTIKAVKDQDSFAAIVTTHGQVGGKMQTSTVHVRKGKNIGKSNATDAISQADLEATAKWKKQLDKGYVESLDTNVLEDAIAKRPMLAQDYAKYKTKVMWPVWVQPKLDGIRCVAHKSGAGEVSLFSRMGKPILTVPHINAQLATMMTGGEVWDGELYIHNVDFQKVVSWIKRAQEDSARVQYHVYDAVAPGDFETRYGNLVTRFKKGKNPAIVPVITQTASGQDEVKEYHDGFVSEGYEGAMVRQNGCPYKEGYRSRDLLKVKMFDEREFQIIGVGDGKGKFEGLAIFRLKTDEGAEFDAVPKGTEEERRAFYDSRADLLGLPAIVRFFEWTTSEPPVPRFPIVVGIRDYE